MFELEFGIETIEGLGAIKKRESYYKHIDIMSYYLGKIKFFIVKESLVFSVFTNKWTIVGLIPYKTYNYGDQNFKYIFCLTVLLNPNKYSFLWSFLK